MRVAFVLRSIEAHPVLYKVNSSKSSELALYSAVQIIQGVCLSWYLNCFMVTVFDRELCERKVVPVCVFIGWMRSYHAPVFPNPQIVCV
jgi:hypothetical protein